MEHTWKLRSKRTFRLGSSRAVANLVPLITMCLAKCACLAHQMCLAPPGSVCLIWNLWSLWSFPTRMTFGDGYGLNWTLLSLAFLRTPPAQNLRSHVVRRQDLPRSNWVKRRAWGLAPFQCHWGLYRNRRLRHTEVHVSAQRKGNCLQSTEKISLPTPASRSLACSAVTTNFGLSCLVCDSLAAPENEHRAHLWLFLY